MTTQWYRSETKTNFCPECSGLLPLPEITGKITCSVCQYSCTTSELSTKVIITESKHKDLHSYGPKVLKDNAAIVKDGSVVCASCGHNELSFKTAQLRSADEGQTIFYQCVKCEHTWSVNA
eukprot:TRINITY_DN9569_c0_g1_i1.p1 TRINITY_DN9569_c0_g1~~TRINITY_DN9569_c0_g1_i1.p1  ORF type:complete len:121 (-),score=15.90 TRINITY_DN9569_c0_g1_i1:113-475(-)